MINQTRNYPIITVKFSNHKPHENSGIDFSMTNGRPTTFSNSALIYYLLFDLLLIFYLTQLDNQCNYIALQLHLVKFLIGTRPITDFLN